MTMVPRRTASSATAFFLTSKDQACFADSEHMTTKTMPTTTVQPRKTRPQCTRKKPPHHPRGPPQRSEERRDVLTRGLTSWRMRLQRSLQGLVTFPLEKTCQNECSLHNTSTRTPKSIPNHRTPPPPSYHLHPIGHAP